ncbi:carboxylesterase/lipase family protein [Streptomyces morookaense]|uniref:Carboxylic ester hydrolase n=1 Tax=Streptomyces morookaense TaxID=1970 RepID=A0A7Y7B7L6_STRMO|nr:carboxylesterase family protein [Streptomyces morookaense]NVK80481.1 carboxylesterase/lipase family protein [Streptomyces morookaense]GHF46615.1 carboxylic ester hydrolase [Streptomyces morookaense]
MSEQPGVRTAEGRIEGLWEQGHAVFRGIPYAQPPVGTLRFAAPAPPLPWEGTRQAVEFGPAVPQSVPHSGPAPASPPGGTDWLTLNVCTPDPGAAGLPVLVWIHGGAYVAGGSDDPMYDPAALAGAGLVVVSINYRVGAEGFALLEGAPANRGFLDQIAALEWVQRNIAAFGGDPGRVTVAGQSAGAGSIAALLTMKEQRGLFRRAITHSVPGWYCSRALAEEVAAALADRLGTVPTAAALSGIGPWRLAEALTALNGELPARRERWGRFSQAGIAICPVIDGEVLSETPWAALNGGRASGAELLVGHTRDEFRLFTFMTGRLGKITDEDARTALDLFAPAPDGPAAYRAAHPRAAAQELFESVYADACFRMPSVLLAEANAGAGGGRSYLFELQLASPALGGVLGACHSLDVPLAFGTLDSATGRQLWGDRPGPEAVAVSKQLRRAWVDFAASGDPGWEAYVPERQLTRVLDVGSGTVPYPEPCSWGIWAGRPPLPFDLV